MTTRPAMAGLQQVRALSHPLRLRLLELFAERPRTTKQAAETMGEPPTRLYHHVAALERAGLVRLSETRQNRGTTEKYFTASESRIGTGGRGVAGATPRDHAAMGMVVFEESRNELVRALAAGLADGSHPMIAVRAVLQLTPARARAVAAELTALLRRLAVASAGPARRRHALRRYSLTVALIPAVEP